MTSDPLLAVQNLGVDFNAGAGERPAVSGISFTIARGEVLALVGESGSGKSVTATALLGLLPGNAAVSGSAVLNGSAPLELIGAKRELLRRVRGARIAAVFQDPFTTFNPVQRVGPQIIEAIRAHDRVAKREAKQRTVEQLRRVGLDDPERIFRSHPHEMSGGQLQRAMIAMATVTGPELLIADEPTTALDVTVQAGILDLLHELREQLGTTILLITHDMGVVADLADHVVVMRDGEVMESGSADRVFTAPQSDYTRELLNAVPRVDVGTDEPAEEPQADRTYAAVVDDVEITYGSGRQQFVATHGVSFQVPSGRTVGLVGESGSGKTTLGKAMVGLAPVTGGSITVAGADISALRGRELRAARSRIGFVFQNPSDSLNPRATVEDAIAEPLVLHGTEDPSARRARAHELLERVRLPAAMASRYPHQLSGGQRQRVAIARALVLNPQLVIADEPTSALDVAVQATILELFAELQAELSFGCLFISHDLAVVRQVASEVVVLRAGRVVESGPSARVLSEPQDSYTQALLAAVPVPDPAVQRARRAAALSTA